MRNWKLLSIFCFIIASCGVVGSLAALLPGATETLGITTDILKHSPFSTFLFPGLFLLIIIGGGNYLGSFYLYRKVKEGMWLILLLGLLMMCWILIQIYFLRMINILHIVFFLCGMAQFLLARNEIKKNKILFPFQANQN